jgi:hypothetical protein
MPKNVAICPMLHRMLGPATSEHPPRPLGVYPDAALDRMLSVTGDPSADQSEPPAQRLVRSEVDSVAEMPVHAGRAGSAPTRGWGCTGGALRASVSEYGAQIGGRKSQLRYVAVQEDRALIAQQGLYGIPQPLAFSLCLQIRKRPWPH